jgi:APA family basic amino acid/polyamine antiporter
MSILSSSPRGIFRRKPVDEVEPEDLEEGGGLQRVLGLWQLTAIGIGGIIGAGIFSLAGTVARQHAGPGVLFSFLVAGVASACAALSYAEFAGMIPKAGSAYTYGYVVLGRVGDIWVLRLLQVAPEHRSHAIGHRLKGHSALVISDTVDMS